MSESLATHMLKTSTLRDEQCNHEHWWYLDTSSQSKQPGFYEIWANDSRVIFQVNTNLAAQISTPSSLSWPLEPRMSSSWLSIYSVLSQVDMVSKYRISVGAGASTVWQFPTTGCWFAWTKKKKKNLRGMPWVNWVEPCKKLSLQFCQRTERHFLCVFFHEIHRVIPSFPLLFPFPIATSRFTALSCLVFLGGNKLTSRNCMMSATIIWEITERW